MATTARKIVEHQGSRFPERHRAVQIKGSIPGKRRAGFRGSQDSSREALEVRADSVKVKEWVPVGRVVVLNSKWVRVKKK